MRMESKANGLAEAVHAELQETVYAAAGNIQATARSTAPVDTGKLRNSIQWRVLGPLAADVIVGAEYGLYVELGSATDEDEGEQKEGEKKRVKRAPRPFLAPAAAAVKPKFKRAVKAVLKKASRA